MAFVYTSSSLFIETPSVSQASTQSTLHQPFFLPSFFQPPNIFRVPNFIQVPSLHSSGFITRVNRTDHVVTSLLCIYFRCLLFCVLQCRWRHRLVQDHHISGRIRNNLSSGANSALIMFSTVHDSSSVVKLIYYSSLLCSELPSKRLSAIL